MSDMQELVEIFGASRVVPGAVRIREVVYAPRISGVEPTSGKYPADFENQLCQALGNLQTMLAEAGASKDNVGRVTAFVSKLEDRETFYKPWDLLYPNSQDRPAAKVLVAPLPPGELIALDAVAIVGKRRTRIDIEGVKARDPTVKIGNWVFSSRVTGADPKRGSVPEKLDAQSRQVFQNIKTLVELAGGKSSNIVQVTAFGKDRSYMPAAQNAFEDLFPDPENRPAFHRLEAYIPPRLALMVEIIAVL